MQFDTDIAQGLSLFAGDPSVITPVSALLPTARFGRGWAYLHVKIAAHAADTCTVGISGRLNANGGFVALTKSDQSTAVSVAQAGGAAVETITTVQLLPEMKVVLSGTRTTGAALNVWVEAIGKASRADS